MKILHTSDLHIGHSVGGVERWDEFRRLFEWFGEVVDREGVDIFLVSGDVFDVYFPSNEAVKLYYDLLLSLKAKVIITGGNHDSPKHLRAPKEILKKIGVEVVSGGEDDFLSVLEFDDFEIVCVSYLREGILRKYDEDLVSAIKKVYERNSKKKKIATAHLSVYGSSVSGSERDIYIGKIEAVPSSVFEGYDYVALGHIHRPQEIKKGIVYSGSPLQLGFRENYQKKVVLLDSENMEYKFIDVPRFRDFVSLKGSFEDVRERIDEIKEGSFVEIELSEVVSSLSLDELRRNDLHIIKINMPFEKKESIKLKEVTPKEFIKEMFDGDEDLDEMLKVIERLGVEDED